MNCAPVATITRPRNAASSATSSDRKKGKACGWSNYAEIMLPFALSRRAYPMKPGSFHGSMTRRTNALHSRNPAASATSRTSSAARCSASARSLKNSTWCCTPHPTASTAPAASGIGRRSTMTITGTSKFSPSWAPRRSRTPSRRSTIRPSPPRPQSSACARPRSIRETPAVFSLAFPICPPGRSETNVLAWPPPCRCGLARGAEGNFSPCAPVAAGQSSATPPSPDPRPIMTRPPEEALKFLVSVLLVGTTLAQTPAKQQLLWQKLDATLHDVDGVMGVAIKDLTSNHTILLQRDEVFPQASSIKIAGRVELYRQAQQGKLK